MEELMLYRTLGSTGEKVSAIGIGGWHIRLKQVDEQLSIRIIRTAVDRGINFMDKPSAGAYVQKTLNSPNSFFTHPNKVACRRDSRKDIGCVAGP